MKLYLLGSFHAVRCGKEVAIPGAKMRALVSYLAITEPESQSRDRLVALLWGDSLDDKARQNLRYMLSTLRKILGPDVLATERDEVSLAQGVVECDVTSFETLIQEGSAAALRAATALYRGTLLDGLSVREEAFQTWMAQERQRLQEMAVAALASLADKELEAGRADEALEFARRAVELDAYFETAHRIVMRALASLGQRGSAIEHYRRLERLLGDHLSVLPDEETKHLRDRIEVGDDTQPEGAQRSTGGDRLRTTVSSRPSIAVLPFANLSQHLDQEYLADGITEDIITELSRFRDLAVLARHLSFSYRGNKASVQQIGRELCADFVLEGSVRRMGNRIRITAQLTDAATGSHVWAERYDQGIEDVFAIHDEITATIVSTLSGQIDDAIVLRARTEPPANWRAYDHLLFGSAAICGDRFSRASYGRAIEHLQRAIEIDPQYARAYGRIAVCYHRMASIFCKGNEIELKLMAAQSRENACRAVALDGNNAEGLNILGWWRIWDGDYAEGEYLTERAYSVNPNDSCATMRFVTALLHVGKPEQAVRLAEATIHHTKPHPNTFLSDLAEAYFYAHRNDESVALYEKLPDIELNENRAAAICGFAYAGDPDRARLQAERYRAELRKNWSGDSNAGVAEMLEWEFQHYLPRSRPDDIKYVRNGLRRAGMPA